MDQDNVFYSKALEATGCKVDYLEKTIKTNRNLDRQFYTDWIHLIKENPMYIFPLRTNDNGSIGVLEGWALMPNN